MTPSQQAAVDTGVKAMSRSRIPAQVSAVSKLKQDPTDREALSLARDILQDSSKPEQWAAATVLGDMIEFGVK